MIWINLNVINATIHAKHATVHQILIVWIVQYPFSRILLLIFVNKNAILVFLLISQPSNANNVKDVKLVLLQIKLVYLALQDNSCMKDNVWLNAQQVKVYIPTKKKINAKNVLLLVSNALISLNQHAIDALNNFFNMEHHAKNIVLPDFIKILLVLNVIYAKIVVHAPGQLLIAQVVQLAIFFKEICV